MAIQAFPTTPVAIYSKTYWTGFIATVNEEAAYELGLHGKVNPEALPTTEGWSAWQFTPNISRHTDVYKWLGPTIDSIGAFLSHTWRDYQRCKATHDYTYQIKSELFEKLPKEHYPIKPLLKRIVDIKFRVDETRYHRFHSYFWACPAILISSGLLTLGVFTKHSDLISSGKITLAISTIYAAAIASLDWIFKDDIKTTYKMIALAPDYLAETALSHLHWYYTERMTLKENDQLNLSTDLPYQPFFKEITNGYTSMPENHPPANYEFQAQHTPLGLL